MKTLYVTTFALVFTAACGGKAFVAGDFAADDGGSTELDSDSIGIIQIPPQNDDDAEAGFDKGSTDGGGGLDSADSTVLFDAGPRDASGRDACGSSVAWTCDENGELASIPVGQFCFAVYANAALSSTLSQFRGMGLPTECDCVDTCACVAAAAPCGAYAFISCTNVADGGPLVLCDAQGH